MPRCHCQLGITHTASDKLLTSESRSPSRDRPTTDPRNASTPPQSLNWFGHCAHFDATDCPNKPGQDHPPTGAGHASPSARRKTSCSVPSRETSLARLDCATRGLGLRRTITRASASYSDSKG